MFSLIQLVTFVTVLAPLYASAEPGLSLSIKGPSSVNGVQDLRVTAKITNTGDETLRILQDPRSLLYKRPVNKFSIAHKKGGRPAFTGVKVKYSPEAAARLGAYTTLAPGASLDVNHDLSEAYNFTNSGTGSYEIEADNTFYIVNENNEIGVVYANQPSAYTTQVSGNLAAARRELDKRASFVSCSAARQALINTAAASAQTYAAEVVTYLQANSSGTTRYTTWFGTFATARYNTVLSHSQLISANTLSYTYDCSCTDSSYAYVYPGNFGKVYFCGAFWDAPNTGTDSRAGTLIHEASHFTKNGGTDDYGYGQANAKKLATSNPARAILNADNREYFAENTPALS